MSTLKNFLKDLVLNISLAGLVAHRLKQITEQELEEMTEEVRDAYVSKQTLTVIEELKEAKLSIVYQTPESYQAVDMENVPEVEIEKLEDNRKHIKVDGMAIEQVFVVTELNRLL